MKLSDFRDEEAIVVVGELLDPILCILQDVSNRDVELSGNYVKMFSQIFKNSPKEMMRIFAILNRKDPETYTCTAVEVMGNIVSLASDAELIGLFTSQGQTGDATSSGSVSVN